MNKINVLMAGTDRKKLFELVGLFENQPRLQIQTRVVPGFEQSLVSSGASHPDIVVLVLDEHWQQALTKLVGIPRHQRPELIVIADAYYSDVMQQSMQAGARDYLVWDQASEGLLGSVNSVANDLLVGRDAHCGKLVAVINSKGGAGGSFVAANIAHLLREVDSKTVALIDLDFIFSPLPAYYDVTPKHSLADALTLPPDEVDVTALSGYMTSHKSGVDILASVTGHLPVSWATPTDRLYHLIELALSTYDYVIIDTPRHIEPQIQHILERADIIFLVMQQSVMHLRDAKLLKHILVREFDIPEEKINTLVNRYDKRNAITPKHIEKALGFGLPWLIPNDYELASQSIESGALVHEISPRGKVGRALRNIVDDLLGGEGDQERGVFGRLFAS